MCGRKLIVCRLYTNSFFTVSESLLAEKLWLCKERNRDHIGQPDGSLRRQLCDNRYTAKDPVHDSKPFITGMPIIDK